MRKTRIDTVREARLEHRPGQRAALATAVTSEGGLLSDITTVRRGEDDTVREVTVETDDDARTERVLTRAHPGTFGIQLIPGKEHPIAVPGKPA